MDLPELGVGLTFFSQAQPLLDTHPHLIDVLEIEPQTLWIQLPDNGFRIDEATLKQIKTFPCSKILHGIGFPVGGVRPPSPVQLPPLKRMASELETPWASEHLSFNEATGPDGTFKTGFLLPPRQSMEGVAAAVASINSVTAELNLPFAVETGVNYLKPRQDEMSDGAFIAEIVEQANCGLLLDLHNIWTNQRNGRQSVDEFMSLLPLERIWEVHLAGGSEYEGYWLDSHSGAMPEELIEVALQIVPRLPNLKALIFELFPPYLFKVGYDVVREQIEALHRIWARRGQHANSPLSSFQGYGAKKGTTLSNGPSPEVWENTLGALVVGNPVEGPLAEELSTDPGLGVVQDLLAEFRASMVISVFKLTGRYLLLHEGKEQFKDLLAAFWRDSPPELFAAQEAQGFAHFLERKQLEVPHLYEILNFERAVIDTLLDGERRIITFSCDPLPFLRALGEGRLPDMVIPGKYELEVTPDDVAPAGVMNLIGMQT